MGDICHQIDNCQIETIVIKLTNLQLRNYFCNQPKQIKGPAHIPQWTVIKFSIQIFKKVAMLLIYYPVNFMFPLFHESLLPHES